MKKRRSNKLASIILLMLVLSCLGTGCTKPDVEHVPITSKIQHDYSEQAQAYFEYIGNNLKDRNNGIFTDHDATQDFIINELKSAGYTDEQITLDKIDGRSGENIVLKVDGKDKTKSIIAGAHYDGDGVGDNGSGIALLLANACGLSKEELPVTTYFIFFDEEESGCIGSADYAEKMSKKDAQNTIYMINMDAIAFGDYCNIYGGEIDHETKTVSKTEGYYHAYDIAKDLGFNVYGPKELDGYFAKHGKGPDLDEKGIFTCPWTKENPAPENTVDEENHAYSPATVPYSDHEPFLRRGIPYVYFEATNWYVKTDYEDMEYIGYTDVGDESVGDGGIIMNTKYDTLETMEEHYPGRSLEHFKLYSPILSRLILEPMK